MDIQEIKEAMCLWTPRDGDEELSETAVRMAEADLDEMGAEHFMSQSPSSISWGFMQVCVDTSFENIEEILAVYDAEKALDELGLGEQQGRLDMSNVVKTVHNNYSKGMGILSHYLELFEWIKEGQE